MIIPHVIEAQDIMGKADGRGIRNLAGIYLQDGAISKLE
jgi:hypothetical protein